MAVQFLMNDTIHTVQAKTEVILAAGTVGSAQTLMLSGIGPRQHLEELGVSG